jgi:hypothetical protein
MEIQMEAIIKRTIEAEVGAEGRGCNARGWGADAGEGGRARATEYEGKGKQTPPLGGGGGVGGMKGYKTLT